MRRIRCHVDMPLACGALLQLPEATANHLLRVLRLSTGDAFVLFNGDGHDYHARLEQVGRAGAQARIGEREAIASESPLRVQLAQGIARGEKMDLILQKATELGVTAIQPLFTERTEVRLDAARMAKRMAHWRNVIASACEQSGRARLPTLAQPTELGALLVAQGHDALRLILDPAGTCLASDLPAPPSAGIVFAVGPEGGFSPRERLQLQGAGYLGLRLGPRVLRTETAGLAALAVLQARFGDLG